MAQDVQDPVSPG